MIVTGVVRSPLSLYVMTCVTGQIAAIRHNDGRDQNESLQCSMVIVCEISELFSVSLLSIVIIWRKQIRMFAMAAILLCIIACTSTRASAVTLSVRLSVTTRTTLISLSFMSTWNRTISD